MKSESILTHRLRSTALSLSLGFIGYMAQPLRAAVIINGGFEEPIVSSTYNLLSGTDMEGWVIAGSVVHFGSAYSAPVGTGNYSVQMHEFTVGLSQTVATDVGSQYLLTFDMSAHPTHPSATTRVGLIQDYGKFVAFAQMFDWEYFTAYDDSYTKQFYYFTATSESTTIGFQGGLYPHLDNVEIFLVAVPEPCSSLLMVFGVVTVLSQRRRKR